MPKENTNPNQDPAKHAIRAKIVNALAETKKYRDSGYSAGARLYGIFDLEAFCPLKPEWGVPTIANERGFPHLLRASSDAQLGKRIRAASGRLFAGFDFAANGLCMAGGAVSARLMHGTQHAKDYCDDFDLFLIGHTEASALKAIRACATHLEKKWPKMKVFRTQNCITFAKGDGNCRPVQIVLRQFDSAAEVLYSFDLGSSAFLWDGAQLRTTALGKLAAEHGVNVLDLGGRRSSYERRLARYFSRGFGLVLPHLDVEALFEMNGRLPYIHTSVTTWNKEQSRLVRTKFDHNTIYVYAIFANIGGADSVSAYQPFTVPYNSTSEIDSRNFSALTAPEINHGALCAWASWSTVCESKMGVMSMQPTIEPSTIEAWIRAAGPNLDRLKKIVGPEWTKKIMNHLLEKGNLRSKTVTTAAIDRAAELNANAQIPFKFATRDSAGGTLGPWPLRECSIEEWYGVARFGGLYTTPPPKPRVVPEIVPAPRKAHENRPEDSVESSDDASGGTSLDTSYDTSQDTSDDSDDTTSD